MTRSPLVQCSVPGCGAEMHEDELRAHERACTSILIGGLLQIPKKDPA